MNTRLYYPLLLCCTLFLCSCANQAGRLVSPLEFSSYQVRSVPLGQLKAGDSIEFSIEVDGRTEKPRQSYKLSGNEGIVTIPLVGDLSVGGLTADEIKSALIQAYSEYYVSLPVVMLNISSSEQGAEWGSVRVLGRVNRPGHVSLGSPDGLHLSDVIQLAGGFSSSAKMNHVQVVRLTPDGEQVYCNVDLTAVGQVAVGVDYDLILDAGDIVYVPERMF